MISMDKTYKTRDGCDVRIACVNAGSNAPVVAVVNDETMVYAADGRFFSAIQRESVWDLIEVSPFADFKIDDPVMVRDSDGHAWQPRYFAGINPIGTPQTFSFGNTKWTNKDSALMQWQQCRHPTAEELAS